MDITEFRLPEDFFWKQNASTGKRELVGALFVHASMDGSWIFLGSDKGFYSIPFDFKLHDLQKGVPDNVPYDKDVQIFEPQYEAAIDMTGGAGVAATVSHIHIAQDSQKIKLPPVEGSAEVRIEDFDVIVNFGSELAFYKYTFEPGKVTQATLVHNAPVYSFTSSDESVAGIAVTQRGLFLATETEMYFFENQDGVINLGTYNAQNPNMLLSGGEQEPRIKKIHALTYSHFDEKEYLALATDAGILIGRDSHFWHEWRIGTSSTGSPISTNVTVAYVDSDSKYEHVFYISPDNASLVAFPPDNPAYQPYMSQLHSLDVYLQGTEELTYEWPVINKLPNTDDVEMPSRPASPPLVKVQYVPNLKSFSDSDIPKHPLSGDVRLAGVGGGRKRNSTTDESDWLSLVVGKSACRSAKSDRDTPVRANESWSKYPSSFPGSSNMEQWVTMGGLPRSKPKK